MSPRFLGAPSRTTPGPKRSLPNGAPKARSGPEPSTPPRSEAHPPLALPRAASPAKVEIERAPEARPGPPSARDTAARGSRLRAFADDPGLSLRLMLAKLRQPRGVAVSFSDTPRLLLRPGAEFDDDPRQPFIIEGNGNRYSHIFRRAAGHLLPLDVAQRYAVETLAPRWAERHGPHIADALLAVVLAPSTLPIFPGVERRKFRDRSFPGADGRPTRLSEVDAERAFQSYVDAERAVRRAFDRLCDAGALTRVRRSGTVRIGPAPARPALEASAPNLANTRLGAALLAVLGEAAAGPRHPVIDAGTLSALGIDVPAVHLDAFGGIRLLDHHRIHGARDAGLSIEVRPTRHIESFN